MRDRLFKIIQRIFPILILFGFANLSYAHAQETIKATSDEIAPNWTMYNNQEYNFYFEYPSDWNLSISIMNVNNSPGVIEQRILILDPSLVGFNIDIFPNPENLSLEEWFNTYQYPFISSEEFIQEGLFIAGEPAIYSIEISDDPFPARHSVIFIHGNSIYRIEYQEFDGGEHLDIYRKLLETFGFQNGEDGIQLFEKMEVVKNLLVNAQDQDCCGYHDSNWNPYPCGNGNCTWWARYKRPDTGGCDNGNPCWNDAENWSRRAAEDGFAVSSMPSTGAIGATPRSGYINPSWTNHVAYVESFNGSTINFTDMDYGEFNCSVDNWNQSSWSGIEFIHSSGSNCPGPSQNNPSDGHVSSNQTISFSWSAPSGCSFSGYQFRIKDTADMNSGGTTIVDTGEGGTSRTETIGTQWNDRDLYWGVRTANPLSPNWSVRRFRIEPGSNQDCGNYNYDGIALFRDSWCHEDSGGPVRFNTEGRRNLTDHGFNDLTRSIHVAPGWSAKIWKHIDGTGSNRCITGSMWDLSIDNYDDGSPIIENDTPTITTVDVYHNTSCTGNPPDAPSLNNPANGSSNPDNYDLNFQWNSSSGATEYLVEWWGGPYGTMQPCGWSSSTSCQIGNVAAGNTYYWHVKARNGAGESGWSSTWTFTIQSSGTDLDCGQVSFDGVILYEHKTCNKYIGGVTKEFSSPTGWIDIVSDPIHEKTSSIYIGSGWSIKVYEAASYDFYNGSYGGSWRCINGSMWDLSIDYYTNINTNQIIDDTISSVQVFNNGNCNSVPISVTGVRIADGDWNEKTSFYPGDPIRWVITVENTTGSSVLVVLTYEVKGPSGQPIGIWEYELTVDNGISNWGLLRSVSAEGGTHTFTGYATYQGETTQASTTYEVTPCYNLDTSVTPGGSGSINAEPAPDCNNGTMYSPNTVVTLSATDSASYEFSTWSGSAATTDNPVDVTMDGDKSVTANYKYIYTEPPADFDGNFSTDVSIFRPTTNRWLIKDQYTTIWGASGDIPVPGDYDGDGNLDVAVYRPSTGKWFIKGQYTAKYGASGDVPVPGDYDGDRVTDIGIFRPSTGKWFIKGQYTARYGRSGDIPIPGDYNGDGITDIAIFRPSTGKWFIKGQYAATYGQSGDIPIPGDYDDDGTWDVALYRPSLGTWYIKDQYNSKYGASGDIPVPGDYDGNGTWDVAIYRPSTSTWYIKGQYSTTYGDSGDYPLPARDTNGDGDPYQ